MRVLGLYSVKIILLLSAVISSRRTESHSLRTSSSSLGIDNRSNGVKGTNQRRAVTEDEISYIASTLQPRECLSLLYLLHHAYKRRRRREDVIEKRTRDRVRSAQITPCETMLLNYWRDPSSKDLRDCYRVSRTLRQVKRQDLARWLCGRKPTCSAKTVAIKNVTNDASLLTAQMQVIPIYSHRRNGPSVNHNSNDSTLESLIWIYIGLAVCATATILLCINYLFNKFRKSSQYITLAERDLRNMQCACECLDRRLSLSCNKKKRYQPPHVQSACACSGN